MTCTGLLPIYCRCRCCFW